jgi:FkbM family methyltransferase
MISYAQNLEDVMLWRALKDVKFGFYVDVGANDPVIDSVTKWFYDQGWSGINIEPLISHFEDLVSARPRDLNIRCAAGNADGVIDLWECDVRGWATASPESIRRHMNSGKTGVFHAVPIRTLTSVLRGHDDRQVHFLKIDVEGLEGDVLRGLDFQTRRPWIVVVEATRPNSTEDSYVDWEFLLTDAAYHFVYGDGLNRFYLADEHIDLAKKFKYPPNVFDSFVTAEKVELANRTIKSEAAQLDILRQNQEYQHRIAELRTDSEVLRTELAQSQIATVLIKGELIDLLARLTIVEREFEAESQLRREERRGFHALGVRYSSLENTHRKLEDQMQRTLQSKSWRMTVPLRWINFQYRLLRLHGLKARTLSLRMRFFEDAGVGKGAPLTGAELTTNSSIQEQLDTVNDSEAIGLTTRELYVRRAFNIAQSDQRR